VSRSRFNRPSVCHDGKFRGYVAFNGFFSDDGFSISYSTNAIPVNLVKNSFDDLAVQVISAVCPYLQPSYC
jgi:hypothetical protein